MSIQDKISINAHYTRSINLERDASSVDVVKAYIPTSRAIHTLGRIADTFKTKQAPRAWSLVGPYGSGKSSFAIFLAHLLGELDEGASKAAGSVLRKANTSLGRRFNNISKGTSGHCYVLLTGSPEPLSKRLTVALAESAKGFWENRRGRNPAIVDELKSLAKEKTVTASKLLSVVKSLQDAVSKAGGNGLLIIIDELGKFLEYEARHYGANDIYILQGLAEHACAGHDANLTLIVMLHQSFEQYAKGLGESLKNEWAKVQGRFENVPFLESTEQVLRVVSAAFVQDISSTEQNKIAKVASESARSLQKEKALPGALDREAAAALFEQCYPLHPISALLLPILCQKVAQNERTLFSYLGSQEPYGFKDSLSRLNSIGDWIYPWEIYEYFILNQPAAISDHVTHRRWAEVVTAVERLGDAKSEELELLKAIGLLNIVGVQGGFKASKDIVGLCLASKKLVNTVAQSLQDKSIIQLRKFSGEYRVWQGSDFDLDASVEEQINTLGRYDLSVELNARHALDPIVTRKYTIKNGALRYFIPTFVDANNYKQIEPKAKEPRIIFFLSEGQEDTILFKNEVHGFYSELDIVVEYLNSTQLRDALSEIMALEGVRREAQELNTDPIAQREFKDRYAVALSAEAKLLDELTENPGASEWYWCNEHLVIPTKRAMQEAMSKVLEKVFCASPAIHNELVNRDKPSSQAAAGRNKLLAAMINNPEKEDLGIDKYPPEKSIYRSILRELGVHKEVAKGEWAFVSPGKRSSLYPVWQRIEQFLESTEADAKPFSELTGELIAPPYGVKEGVLPILYIAVYIAHQHELALYENRVYVPYLTEELLERFVKVPHEYTVQQFRIKGLRASIYAQYSYALFEGKQKKSVIELVRPIAQFVGNLEEYTKKTKSSHLSERAKALRTAFNLAKSPEKLLFEDLPLALGYEIRTIEADNPSELEGFSKVLMDTLRELKYAYKDMLKNQQRLLAQAFHMDADIELEELRRKMIGRYAGLEQYTVDVDGLKAFIKRLIKSSGLDQDWLENILMFLGKKPSSKWLDSDRSEADVKLSDYSKRILDLETLRLHYEKNSNNNDGDFDVILLKSLKKGCEPIDEVVAIDKKRHDCIKSVKAELMNAVSNYKDKELQLAAIAEFVDDFLIDYRVNQNSKHRRNPGRPKRAANDQ